MIEFNFFFKALLSIFFVVVLIFLGLLIFFIYFRYITFLMAFKMINDIVKEGAKRNFIELNY